MIEGMKELAVVAGIGLLSGTGSMVLKELGQPGAATGLGIAGYLAAGIVVVKLMQRVVDEVEDVFGVDIL